MRFQIRPFIDGPPNVTICNESQNFENWTTTKGLRYQVIIKNKMAKCKLRKV